MTRKLPAVFAAAAFAAAVGLASEPASAQFVRPHGGGGGGSMGAMHFAPRGFGAGPMMHLGSRGFAESRFLRSGGFAHYGYSHSAVGRALGWNRPAVRSAGLGRPLSTPVGANWPYHHGWQGWRGYRRGWIGWAGPVFWPYAYDDLFDYAFWPYGPYDDLFWSYGYDDVFAGILLPYALLGLEGGYGYGGGDAYASGHPVVASAEQTGAGASGGGSAPTSSAQLCGSAESLGGGAAIDAIAKTVHPTAEQNAKLDALKNAEADAAKTLSASCGERTPSTVTARLDAVQSRLQAMIQAANAVGGPLGDFYASLTDEQKAVFNALGQGKAGTPNLSQACGPRNSVPVVATDQIDAAVQPDAKQQVALAALRDAAGKADDAVLASCPKEAPLTPTGRLDAVKARLQAMLDGVNTVRQPLQDFYASLSDAQKAKLDALTAPPQPTLSSAEAQP